MDWRKAAASLLLLAASVGIISNPVQAVSVSGPAPSVSAPTLPDYLPEADIAKDRAQAQWPESGDAEIKGNVQEWMVRAAMYLVWLMRDVRLFTMFVRYQVERLSSAAAAQFVVNFWRPLVDECLALAYYEHTLSMQIVQSTLYRLVMTHTNDPQLATQVSLALREVVYQLISQHYLR